MLNNFLKTITSCTTWECINSFANWLSAIGTILITGLALWLTVKDRMIHVSAELNVGLVPSNNPLVLDTRVYILSFTNVGPRPVTITNHCWFLPFSKGVIFLMPHMDSVLGKLCSKLPLELTDGKEGHAFYSHDFFSKLEEPEKVLFHKNHFIAWIRIHFFKVRIATTIGKRLKVKIKPAVRRQL
jgi:hypothetical protein